MPEFLQIVSALREQMSASLSRSDALRPLSWLIGIMLITFLGCIFEKAEQWILISNVVGLGLVITVYLIVYVFFAVTNPDATRSEKYTLNKMAIEHGWRGDSLAGTVDARETQKVGATKVIGFDGDANG